MKILSSHDALDDPLLSKEYAVSVELLQKQKEKEDSLEINKTKLKQKIAEKMKRINKPLENQEEIGMDQNYIKNYTEKMKEDIIQKRKRMGDSKINITEELKKLKSEEESSEEEDEKLIGITEILSQKRNKNRLQMHKTEKFNLSESGSESQSEYESDDEKYLTEEQK